MLSNLNLLSAALAGTNDIPAADELEAAIIGTHDIYSQIVSSSIA